MVNPVAARARVTAVRSEALRTHTTASSAWRSEGPPPKCAEGRRWALKLQRRGRGGAVWWWWSPPTPVVVLTCFVGVAADEPCCGSIGGGEAALVAAPSSGIAVGVGSGGGGHPGIAPPVAVAPADW